MWSCFVLHQLCVLSSCLTSIMCFIMLFDINYMCYHALIYHRHVEELVRLPECFLCYTPSPEAGSVSSAPALSNGFITFGSFNNLAKVKINGNCAYKHETPPLIISLKRAATIQFPNSC